MKKVLRWVKVALSVLPLLVPFVPKKERKILEGVAEVGSEVVEIIEK